MNIPARSRLTLVLLLPESIGEITLQPLFDRTLNPQTQQGNEWNE